MPATDRSTPAGVSLRDVNDCLRAIESEHCCNTSVTLTMPTVSGTSVLFWVKVAAEPRIVGRKTVRAPHAVSGRWPHVDHKTLAGLMFKLCHQLDNELDIRGHLPAEQAKFAWE